MKNQVVLHPPMFRLIRVIFLRDFKAQFRRTLFGPVLAFMAPVISLVVFIFFRMMFGLPESEDAPVLPFLFSGVSLWLFFSASVSGVYPSVSSNMGILRKMPVNPLAFALSSLGMPVLTVITYLVLLLGMSLFFGVHPSLSWLCLPFFIIFLGGFALGVGLLVCALGIYRRDIIVLLPIILQLGMFVTPIFFSPEIVPAQFRWVVAINPVAHSVSMFRNALFLGQWPDGVSFCVILASTALVWLIGYPFFRRTLRYAADTI